MNLLNILITIFGCILALVCSATVEHLEQTNISPESLLNVDYGAENSNDGQRKARQIYGYYGRPYYNYYGGYGGYYRPYYGYGFVRPYYGNYGFYYRPYYGYGGFYG